MNKWEANGRRFQVVLASDVIRDGMGLELTDLDQERGPGPALEVFRSDVDQSLTFTALRTVEVPMEILAQFIDTALQQLRPSE